MQYSRTNQGGSVLTFVIVGVVLAAMVVGGVYLLRQRGEQARGSQPTVGQTDTNKQQGQPAAKPSEENKDKKPETNNNSSQTKPEEEKPSTEGSAQPQNSGNTQIPATGQPAPPATEQQSGTRPNVATGTPVDHSGALPQTGPFDTALQLLAAGTLTALVIAYIRSKLQAVPSL